MSSAFVRELENQWLHDIPPTMMALMRYLANENNGIVVHEKEAFTDPATGKQIHKMSNGFSYAIDENSKWYALG
ncbi:MAG: hypothetical protein ABI763_12915 [Bacteroidota bacterium]